MSSTAVPIKPNSSASASKNATPSNGTKQSSSKGGKKRKRSSPFRIKVGCVVAMRYRSPGNHISTPPGTPLQRFPVQNYAEVWTDPLPGRDDGLALIGRWIRCCFQREDQPKPLFLEGEIVSIVDYATQFHKARKARRRRQPYGMEVELLVDKDRAQASNGFWKRVEDGIPATATKEQQYEDIIRGKNKTIVRVVLADKSGVVSTKGETKRSDGMVVAKWIIRKQVPAKYPTETIKKNGHTEDRTAKARNILGGTGNTGKTNEKKRKENGDFPELSSNGVTPEEDKTKKADKNGSTKPLDSEKIASKENTKSQEANSNKNDNKKATDRPQKKRRLNGSGDAAARSSSRYIGDGNDKPVQQEKNWRWLAGRYHDLAMLSNDGSDLNDLDRRLSCGLVGEVIGVHASASSSAKKTLAMVTVRRLLLPEQTVWGRQAHHGPFDLFEDFDAFVSSDGKKDPSLFQIPVEELVIVSRKFHRMDLGDSCQAPPDQPGISLSYSMVANCYVPLKLCQKVKSEVAASHEDTVAARTFNTLPLADSSRWCHQCRKFIPSICTKPQNGSAEEVSGGQEDFVVKTSIGQKRVWCNSCQQDRALMQLRSDDICDCRDCQLIAGTDLAECLSSSLASAIAEDDAECQSKDKGGVAQTCLALDAIQPVAFHLPEDFMNLKSVYAPATKPITRIKAKAMNKKGRKAGTKTAKEKKAGSQNKKDSSRDTAASESQTEDHPVFRHACSRILVYDRSKQSLEGITKQELNKQQGRSLESGKSSRFSDKPRNLRLNVLALPSEQVKDGKITSGRAARANQRRLMKDVAAIGATVLSLDALAGREQQLRFDRSSIHAWGVFADEAIGAGEMIAEYRGEIIGNAMAEKREKEYEAANIGSDYMFRIDAFSVCDATKQGNVARFLNASCDPNCYTKIIPLDGDKRIVIYAKRDIQAGEELCYDYKFPLEYDESKRIPCHCGARDCRGFMNWDKRYVAMPPPPPQEVSTDQKALKNASPP